MPKCNQCNRPFTLEELTDSKGRVHKNCSECLDRRRRHLTVLNHRTQLPTEGPYTVKWVQESHNRKVGPIPEAYVSSVTCPPSCSLFNHGCYGESGYLRQFWRQASNRGINWNQFLERVRVLPAGQLWRYGIVGDLPGVGEAVDDYALSALVRANHGRRGFTFTHKRSDHALLAVRYCNANGFTVNLSANTLQEADWMVGFGPVVVIQSTDLHWSFTPNGRDVYRCPATLVGSKTTCATCGLCAQPHRKLIVGFPAHGLRKREVAEVCGG